MLAVRHEMTLRMTTQNFHASGVSPATALTVLSHRRCDYQHSKRTVIEDSFALTEREKHAVRTQPHWRYPGSQGYDPVIGVVGPRL